MILDLTKRHLGVDIALDVMQRDPATQTALDARHDAKDAERFAAEPATPSAFAPLDAVECSRCEGSGALPVGECGAYYRDGQTYDSPGMVVCEDCAGVGSLDYVRWSEQGLDPALVDPIDPKEWM